MFESQVFLDVKNLLNLVEILKKKNLEIIYKKSLKLDKR